MRFHHY